MFFLEPRLQQRLNTLKHGVTVTKQRISTQRISGADFEQRIIGRGINEWQNDFCGPLSMPNGSTGTRVVAVNTAKHYIIPIETLLKIFDFSVHKAA